jgi:alpha-methylacyl-CoA racemase
VQLDHITVLDMSRLLPGPYGTQLLRDMGAEVIKIEDPVVGDYTRGGKTAPKDEPTLFNLVNRGKKSITLDLKTDAGKEVFFRLVEDADVVLEQFRPGVVERLGVDYESVQEYNPEIVYCSLTGYGQNGPYRNRVGHDINYLGLAGLLDLNRNSEDESPRIPPYNLADMAGGIFASYSILGALLSRERTGRGEYIDVSMTDSILSFSLVRLAEVLTGQNPRPGKTRHTGLNPWYNVYETADGEYVTFAANEPKFWRNFCEKVGREDLIDLHTSRESISDEAVRQQLAETLSEIFRSRTRDEWVAFGDETTIGPVLTLSEAIDHPQIESRGILVNPDEAPPRLSFPAVSSEGFSRSQSFVPDRGENTEEVLQAFSFTEDEIESLKERSAFGSD